MAVTFTRSKSEKVEDADSVLLSISFITRDKKNKVQTEEISLDKVSEECTHKFVKISDAFGIISKDIVLDYESKVIDGNCLIDINNLDEVS